MEKRTPNLLDERRKPPTLSSDDRQAGKPPTMYRGYVMFDGYDIKGFYVAETAWSVPHDLARIDTPSAVYLRGLPIERNPLDGSTVIGEATAHDRGLDIVRGYDYTSKQDGEDTHAIIADRQHAIIFGDRPHDRRIIADVVDHFRAVGVNPYIAIVDSEAINDLGDDCPF